MLVKIFVVVLFLFATTRKASASICSSHTLQEQKDLFNDATYLMKPRDIQKIRELQCSVGVTSNSVEDGVTHWRDGFLCCPYSVVHLAYPIAICDPKCYDPRNCTSMGNATAVPVLREIELKQRGESNENATILELPVACTCKAKSPKNKSMCKRTLRRRHRMQTEK